MKEYAALYALWRARETTARYYYQNENDKFLVQNPLGEPKFTFILYQKLISTPGLNSKWVAQIKHILQDCGRPDLWEQQAPIQSTASMIKQCLVDQFYQNWSTNPENSSKHRNHTIFKENIKLEEYFLRLPKFMYEYLARFRTGNHRFPCETGRYQNVEYAERKCTLCNLEDVGDEMHYLLICPFFQNERRM